MKKIGVVSVGRSDFGLLYPLIKEINKYRHIKILFFAAAFFQNFLVIQVVKLKVKISK